MNAIRWSARVLGGLVVALFVVFAIGQGVNPAKVGGAEIAQFLVLLVALSGMLVVWRRELLGGMMVLSGMLAFYAINFAASGNWPSGWVFPLCFVPGVLALVSSARSGTAASRRLPTT